VDLKPLGLKGVFGIVSSTFIDERGSFVRVWNQEIFSDYLGLNQSSVVINPKERTLRGLHYQSNPNSETKIVQCIAGSVFDVVVDIRPGSSTFCKFISIRLGPKEKFQGILVPKGFAHGYLTLESNSILLYFMDQPFVPESAKGIVWNDSNLQIPWPYRPEVMSARDAEFPHIKSL